MNGLDSHSKGKKAYIATFFAMIAFACILLFSPVISDESSAEDPGGTFGNLTWSLVDGTLTIDGEGDMPKDQSIPWDAHKSGITSVVIGDGVTSVCDSAFEYCSNVTSISIGSSVTEIGDYAFSGTNVTAITIPESIGYIGTNAFANIVNLKNISTFSVSRYSGSERCYRHLIRRFSWRG